MAAPKLTPWFVNGEKPVRSGVYETKLLGASGKVIEEGWSFWNGRRWSNQRLNKESAYLADMTGGCQEKLWRGLAEKPE